MKIYYNLWDKIIDRNNIIQAHYNARRDKSYYKEVQEVNSNLDFYVDKIHNELKNHTYTITPSDYTSEIINDKGKERQLDKLPYITHRIIQHAINQVLVPIFMQTFCYHTCASLKNRWLHHAYSLVTKYLKDVNWTQYCLKIDIKKFYPSIDHQILKDLLRKKIWDKDVLWLLDLIIDSYWWDKGIPIWSYLSQYLANFYLAYFDHYMKEELKCKYVVRYMDDIVVLSDNKIFLHKVLELMRKELKNLKLEIKENYQVFPVEARWIDFVWYRFFHRYILLRDRTKRRIKKKLRKIKEKTERHKLLNYSEWCSVNSYVWWIMYCNHYRLFDKYIDPLIPWLNRYYYYVLSKKNKKKCKKYYNKLKNKKF